MKGAAAIQQPRTAVIYARYSTHRQSEQSIEGQLRVCYEYAKREGVSIVGEYIDRALSGRSDDRPEFQRMLKDSDKQEFQTVLVYKLDRFARNRYDSAMYRHLFKLNGVKIVSATEYISDAPEGVILEAVLEASAEYYSRELSQKIKRGNRESKLKGFYTGGGIPYGYKVENKRIVVDPQKAEIVKYIFEEYAAGVPRQDIIREINAKGFLASNGKPFGHSAFTRFFTNEKYIGKYEYDGEQRDGYYPPLIDPIIFDKARARLLKNKRAPSKVRAIAEYLLSGKFHCGYCSASMIGDAGTSRNGDRHFYYTCYNRKKHHTCKKASEKKDFIEWYVVEQTVLYVLDPKRIEYIAARVVAQYEKEFNKDIVKDLERRARQIENEINSKVEAFTETKSERVKAALELKIEQLDAKLQDVQIDLAKMRVAAEIQYTKEEIIAWIKLFTRGDLMDEDFRKRIIDVFVNSVYFYDDYLVIYFNVKDSKQVSYIEMLESTEQPDDDNDDPPPDNGGNGGGSPPPEGGSGGNTPQNSGKSPQNGLKSAQNVFVPCSATTTTRNNVRTPSPDGEGSGVRMLKRNLPSRATTYDPPGEMRYIFVKGLFGIVVPFNKNKK